MRVRIELVVEVDVPAWQLTYGVPPDRVRSDVKQYVREQVDGSAAVDERCITSVTLAGN